MSRRYAALAAAVVVACALLAVVAAAGLGLPFRLPHQWYLDIERAMDVAGLTSGMVIGEAGAGDGYFTLPMARRVGPKGLVYANDISTHSLSDLERNSTRAGLTNIRTVVGEVADPRFPRRDLQLVVVVHAFHDFDRPVEWLVSLKKYLGPGATVAIIDRDPEQGGDSHFWPRARIEGYAAEAGYELTRADSFTGHLVLVFKPGAS